MCNKKEKGAMIIFTQKIKNKKRIAFGKNFLRGTILLGSSIAIISAFIFSQYKLMYKASFKGEIIGYIDDAKKTSQIVDDYLNYGEGENAAFVYIEEKPSYNLCLVKKDTQDSSEDVLNKVKESGTIYYETYVVKSEGQEKLYLSSEEEAKSVIEKVESKKGVNTNLQYEVRYVEELENSNPDEAVSSLYVAKKTTKKKATYTSRSGSSSNTSSSSNSTSTASVASGTFIKPVNGVYTSRHGGGHKGVDIAGPAGTSIVAAASGTVVTSKALRNANGTYRSYGEYIIIDHGNGLQTLYAHLSTRSVSVGQYVSQGQVIGTRGSTGNSTGPHLHFEIRSGNSYLNPNKYF